MLSLSPTYTLSLVTTCHTTSLSCSGSGSAGTMNNDSAARCDRAQGHGALLPQGLQGRAWPNGADSLRGWGRQGAPAGLAQLAQRRQLYDQADLDDLKPAWGRRIDKQMLLAAETVGGWRMPLYAPWLRAEATSKAVGAAADPQTPIGSNGDESFAANDSEAPRTSAGPQPDNATPNSGPSSDGREGGKGLGGKSLPARPAAVQPDGPAAPLPDPLQGSWKDLHSCLTENATELLLAMKFRELRAKLPEAALVAQHLLQLPPGAAGGGDAPPSITNMALGIPRPASPAEALPQRALLLLTLVVHGGGNHQHADERLHDARGAMALADALARHILKLQHQQQQGASSSGGGGGGRGGTAAAGQGGAPALGLGLTHAELLALAGLMSGVTVAALSHGSKLPPATTSSTGATAAQRLPRQRLEEATSLDTLLRVARYFVDQASRIAAPPPAHLQLHVAQMAGMAHGTAAVSGAVAAADMAAGGRELAHMLIKGGQRPRGQAVAQHMADPGMAFRDAYRRTAGDYRNTPAVASALAEAKRGGEISQEDAEGAVGLFSTLLGHLPDVVLKGGGGPGGRAAGGGGAAAVAAALPAGDELWDAGPRAALFRALFEAKAEGVPQLLRASGPEAAHFLAAHVAAVSELPVAGAPAGQRQAAAAAALGGLRPGAACPLALQPVASERASQQATPVVTSWLRRCAPDLTARAARLQADAGACVDLQLPLGAGSASSQQQQRKGGGGSAGRSGAGGGKGGKGSCSATSPEEEAFRAALREQLDCPARRGAVVRGPAARQPQQEALLAALQQLAQVRLELQADGRDLAVLPVLLPEGGGQQQQQHGYGPGGSSTGRWSAPAAQNALDILAEDDLRAESYIVRSAGCSDGRPRVTDPWVTWLPRWRLALRHVLSLALGLPAAGSFRGRRQGVFMMGMMDFMDVTGRKVERAAAGVGVLYPRPVGGAGAGGGGRGGGEQLRVELVVVEVEGQGEGEGEEGAGPGREQLVPVAVEEEGGDEEVEQEGGGVDVEDGRVGVWRDAEGGESGTYSRPWGPAEGGGYLWRPQEADSDNDSDAGEAPLGRPGQGQQQQQRQQQELEQQQQEREQRGQSSARGMVDIHQWMQQMFGHKPREAGRPGPGAGATVSGGPGSSAGLQRGKVEPVLPTSWMDELD